jgi:hypothetical protein
MCCCWNPICHCFRYHWYHCLTGLGFLPRVAAPVIFLLPIGRQEGAVDSVQESDGRKLGRATRCHRGREGHESRGSRNNAPCGALNLSSSNDYIGHRAVYHHGKAQKWHMKTKQPIKCIVYNRIELAEREGFEPPVPFRARRFSRPEPSTTRPPLRLVLFYYSFVV